MAKQTVRYFKGPAFTAAEWSGRNPYLSKGEIGYLMEGGIVIAGKVGPGYWNDLGFIGEDIYLYEDAVTNPIGDATGVLTGNTVAEILNKMLNPYQAPAVSGLINNAGGVYNATVTREIGQAVNGPVSISFSISNEANLSGATPINVTAGNVFSNEGDFAVNAIPIALSLGAPLNPSIPQIVTIAVRLTHLQGLSQAYNTIINFFPKIMWVSSALSSIPDGATFMSLSNRQTLVTNNYKRDYQFLNSGYSWLAIPEMLNPTNFVFTDVTDPNAPAGYGIDDMGSLAINNGAATYNYRMLRSSFNLINPTILRVS